MKTQYVIVGFSGVGASGYVEGWFVESLRGAWKAISNCTNPQTIMGIKSEANKRQIKQYLKDGYCGYNTNH